jgi:N-acetylneuraminic acid mutarotase
MERHGTRKPLAVLILAFAVAGCGSATLPPSAESSGAAPSGATPSAPGGGSTGGTPAADVTLPPTAEPTATPTPAASPVPTPRPTAKPKPVKAHWDTLGVVGPKSVGEEIHAAALAGDRVLFLGTKGDKPYAALLNARTGKVRAVAPLNAPRSDFIVVTLRDGRALVVGGTNDKSQSYSSAYIFKADGNGSWTKTGLLDQARTAPCAAVLRDGRVLVAGGYFQVKPDWGFVAPRATLAIARPGGGAGPVPDYDVSPPFQGNALATAELFDPATGKWSKTGAMRYARAGCQAATLADGRVLVVGSGCGDNGIRIDGQACTTAEIYDPATGRFTAAGTLPEVNRSRYPDLYGAGGDEGPGSLAALRDGGAVLIGHTYWWKHQGEATRSFRFDAKKRTWREIGKTWAIMWDPMADAPSTTTPGVRNLAGAQVATLPDGRVLVAGGGTGIEGRTRTSAAALVYNPTKNRWGRLPPMPRAQAGGAVVTLGDGSVVIAGGMIETPDEWVPLRSIVRFTPAR